MHAQNAVAEKRVPRSPTPLPPVCIAVTAVEAAATGPTLASASEQQALRDKISGLKAQLATADAAVQTDVEHDTEQLRAVLATAQKTHAALTAGLQLRLDAAEAELSDVRVRRKTRRQRSDERSFACLLTVSDSMPNDAGVVRNTWSPPPATRPMLHGSAT